MEVLLFLKGMFGIPSGAISDMRQGIRATLDEAFPEIPRRICLFHSLRDTGSDLMKSMHIDLGRDINRIGIKSALKEISAYPCLITIRRLYTRLNMDSAATVRRWK